MARVNPGIASALVAALLFGASTPLAKGLLQGLSPLLLAGLLYTGSGLGLLVLLALRGHAQATSRTQQSGFKADRKSVV